MYLSEFDFPLPPGLIAQEPTPERGESRLLTLDRRTGEVADQLFGDLPVLLRPGDLLVVNDTRVFAARLLGTRLPGEAPPSVSSSGASIVRLNRASCGRRSSIRASGCQKARGSNSERTSIAFTPRFWRAVSMGAGWSGCGLTAAP